MSILGYILRPRIPGSLNSPSTVSTSSLAQLHEKLAALPRYSYDKEPVSVCAQPQLSSVTEVSESEENHSVNASLSTIRLRTYGVCRKKNVTVNNSTSKSNSDYSKETCNLSPVVNDNENSVSCLLVATIGSADDSVINDTIERLPKDIPCNTDNIVDLLAQEALQATSKEHCNSIAQVEKESDCQERNFFQIEKYSKSAIEKATVYEYEFAHDRGNVNNQPDIEELSNEIVDNTPAHITVRKSKRLKDNKSLNCNAASVNLNEVDPAVLIHDIQAVEDFFTQHVSENKHGDLVISPTLAKKINETSSECSEDFDSFLVTNNHNFVQDNDNDQFLDIDVIECLNAMVDKVCEDFDKCTRYLDSRAEKKTDKTKVKTFVKSQKVQNPMNNTKEKAIEEKQKPKRRTLKLKINAKRLSTKDTKKLNKVDKSRPFTIMSPIIERENVVEEQIMKSTPATPKKLEKPMSLRKRKLYSPKDELCNVNKVVDVIESSEDNSTSTSEVKVYCKTPKSTATCYKELEKARKKRIRQPRTRKFNTSTVSTPSPRTVKNNEIFDSLKVVVDGEKVTLIDKNKVAELYNFTSDSEDENAKSDTKLKKASAKDYSPTVNSAKITKQAPRKARKRSDNTNNSVDICEKSNNKAAKRKRYLSTRTVSTRSQKEIVSIIPDPEINLEDERLRSQAPDILNTSILIEMSKEMDKPTRKEPELVLKEKPQLETVTDDDIELVEHNKQSVKHYAPNTKSKKNLSLKRHGNTSKDNLDTTVNEKLDCTFTKDDAKMENNQHNVRNTKSKKIPSLNRNRDIAKDNLDTNNVDKEKTVSPLPGLVVETDLLGREKNDASITEISENMLQKFKDIYQGKTVEESEANATQNLLSDVELNNDASIQLNITEELNQEVPKKQKKNVTRKRANSKSDKENENTNKNIRKKLTKKEILKIKQERPSTMAQASEPEVIQLSPTTDFVSEKTIATLGNTRSPITGHGDFNQNPPSSTLLNAVIEPRELEHEYLNQSLKEFFSKLNKDLEDANDTASNKSDSKGSSKRNNKSNCLSPKSSIWSPVVTISRLSADDIRLLTSNCSKPSSGDSEIAKTNSKVSSIQIIQETTTAVIEAHNDRSVRTRSKTHIQNTGRKSMISPIKLFEDMNDLNKIEPFGSEKKFSENDKTVSPKVQQIPSKAKVNKTPSKYKKPVKKTIITSSSISSKQTSVLEELNRGDPMCSGSSVSSKRKSSPLLRSSKRSKLEVNNNVGTAVLQSVASFEASSIDDWFKGNKPSGPAESLNLSIKDNIHSVLEKLDTTLVEIHHNTSKRFINMFVDTQKCLKSLMEKRQELYRKTAAEILSEVVKIMNEKFSELDKKSQTLDEELMGELKEKARVVIREECRQKRVMVALLREDVQAALDLAARRAGGD